MGTDDRLRVLQVYNISTAAPNDLIKQLFQHFGRIDEFQVYPILVTAQTNQKVAYVRYEKEKSVVIAQHLTNTVFFDRALICVPTTTNTIPDEETALLNSAALGKRVLPSHVTNQVQENEHGQKMLYTIDPTLTNLGLPAYPPLGADLDSEIVEQTRRTIYVGNLKKDVNPEDLVKFFNTIGEVMYLRMANINEHHDCAYAYVEFTNQTSVPQALQNDGAEFQEQPIRIQHSRVAVVKPQQKTEDQALEEIEEAIRRRDRGEPSPPRRRTRTPSPRKSRRRSRTPPRRSRSRVRDRERERSKKDDRPSRDKDRRDRKDDRDRKDEKESRRDREKERDKDRRRSRSPRKEKDDKKERDREREKDKDKSAEKSRDRHRSKEKEREKDKEKMEKRNYYDKEKELKPTKIIKEEVLPVDTKEKDKKLDKSKEKEKRRSRSPRKDDKKERRRSRSKSPDRKKRREDGKKKDKKSKSSRKHSREENKAKDEPKSRKAEIKPQEITPDRDEPMPLAKEEMSIRERLLEKQRKKHRESDEMDISD